MNSKAKAKKKNDATTNTKTGAGIDKHMTRRQLDKKEKMKKRNGIHPYNISFLKE